MRLTRKNYHSPAANTEFMSASQFKAFMDCPARAVAEIKGEYSMQSDSLLQGSFLDAYFDKRTDEFRAEHPEMFKKDGSLLQKFEKVNDAISVIEADPVMRKLCHGKQQKIMTGEIGGVPFKIMIDSLHPDKTVDRKYMKDFKDVKKDGIYVPWWKAYGYNYQGAIYQEIRRQNEFKKLPFDLAAVTKQDVPDKAWIRFSDDYLETVLEEVEHYAPIFKAMKDGLIEANGCGECEYCRSKKRLTEPEII